MPPPPASWLVCLRLDIYEWYDDDDDDDDDIVVVVRMGVSMG
jgi:hypothetical protein